MNHGIDNARAEVEQEVAMSGMSFMIAVCIGWVNKYLNRVIGYTR